MTTRMFLPLLLALGMLSLASHAVAEDPADPQGAIRGLQLRIEHDLEEVEAGTRFAMTTHFVNRGEQDLQLYQPLHVGLVPFPQWTFRSASGDVYVPRGAPFQSMFRKGLQGEVLRLAKGEQHLLTQHFLQFRKKGAGEAPGGDPVHLPAGRYTVRARYVQGSTEVPFAESMGRQVMRPIEGLWTGDVSSAPATVHIRASKRPTLALHMPKELTSGGAAPLRITLTNHAVQPLRTKAILEVGVGTKAHGSCYARFAIRGERLVPTGGLAVNPIDLASGESLSLSLDLGATDMYVTNAMGGVGRGQARVVGLHDVIPAGSFRITAHLMDEGGNSIARGGLRRSMQPLTLRTDVLDVRIEPLSMTHRRAPVVDVVVTNKSDQAVRLPAGLHYPANLFFSLEPRGKRGSYRLTTDADGGFGIGFPGDEPGQLARIAEGLSWRLGACEARGAPSSAAHVLLPPGGELRRRFRIADLVHTGDALNWGPLQLRAHFRSRESGARMGLEAFFVGRVVSKPVEVRGGVW